MKILQPERSRIYNLILLGLHSQTGLLRTGEYEVQHPRWQTYEVTDYTISVNFELSYGPVFGFLNNLYPQSILLAEGSPIKVLQGSRIR